MYVYKYSGFWLNECLFRREICLNGTATYRYQNTGSQLVLLKQNSLHTLTLQPIQPCMCMLYKMNIRKG